MMRILLFLLTIIATVLVSSCSKENRSNIQDCLTSASDSDVIETFYDEVFDSLQCRLQNIELSFQNREEKRVITTQADYAKYLSCAKGGLPEIDFQQYFLLAGGYQNGNMVRVSSKTVLKCENKLVFSVMLEEGFGNTTTDVFYFAVVSNHYKQMAVNFIVQFEEY